MADIFDYDFSDEEEDCTSDHTISDIDDSDESDDELSRYLRSNHLREKIVTSF